MREWLDRLLTWDERQDPAQSHRVAAPKPWHALSAGDRQLLDYIADGSWNHEDDLRRQLGWGRFRFFVTTLRMVEAGWIEARPADENSIFGKSRYRVKPGAW